jgi:ectoine hydroxylase-related dioxygenase (phytanoyl-CoA dioxygenase family)
MEKLTTEQVQYYHRNGYLLSYKSVLQEKIFTELERRFNDYYESHQDEHVWDCPHWNDSWFLDLLCSKDIIDNYVEPLIGPNIAIWASSFLFKAPYKGKATPWHEDSAYFKDRLDRFDNMVTIWLAIDPSKRENGCMKVIPGTHNNGFSDYEETDINEDIFYHKIKNSIDESKTIYLELNKNECSFHDSRIIHGAEKNTSSSRRCGFQMRYFPTSVKFNPFFYETKNENFKIYLAKGKDLAGNVYADA